MSRLVLTPAAIVSDAAELADTEGLDAVTISAVARRLGVRAPSIYSHVRDHASLLDGVTVLALGALAGRIAEATVGRSEKRALHGFAEAHRAMAGETPGRWQALQRRAGPLASGSGEAARLVTLTTVVLEGYHLAEANRVHAIRLVGSTINGFLALEAAGSFAHSQPAPAESWTRAIDGLHTVLTTWSTSSRQDTDR